MNRTVLSLITVLLTACASNIASKVDLNNVNFEVGRTSNKEVINTLGLPERVVRATNGTEKYFYAGAARLTGFVTGGAGTGVHGAGPGLLDGAINDSMVQDGAVYKFDKNGILVFEDSPRTRIVK